MHQSLLILLLVFSGSCCSLSMAAEEVAPPAKGQLEAKPETPTKKSALQRKIDRSLERYQVFEGDDQKPMKAVYPVLAWTNPIAGLKRKARTVLFVKDGQAKCVCCIWPSGPRLYHEFGALSREELRGELDEKPSWNFDKASIQFKEIPNAKAPAHDRVRRMVQMRQLSRRFGAVEMRNRKRETDRVQLRMLTTPLYRYEKESAQILDGALFCFADGTDPEAVLVVEAVRDGDDSRWEYAFKRRTTLPVTGQLDDETVWDTRTTGWTGFNQLGYRE